MVVTREGGEVSVKVDGDDEQVVCEIEDDGIGREVSKMNKPVTPVVHHSRGISLSQARLGLEKKLSDKTATIEIVDKYEDETASSSPVLIFT